MTTQAQLLSLIRSHSEGDKSRFQAVSLQLASEAAKKGNKALADEIKALIVEARQNHGQFSIGAEPIPAIRPRGELNGIVSAKYALTRLDDMVLAPSVLAQLNRVVEEQRNRQKLAEHGLRPRRKLLLIGPPGTGKTMTAAALAGELSLPLFSVLLDGLITKFMGETASKLRLVFDAMRETRGVYFFDEFDAIASSRQIMNDVGEARRMLNSILQLFDEDKSDSIIIAATNHKELLDRAIFRRFDTAVEYGTLPKDFIQLVFEKSLFSFPLSAVNWSEISHESFGLSQAVLVRSAENAARAAVLENNAVVTTEILRSAIAESRSFAGED